LVFARLRYPFDYSANRGVTRLESGSSLPSLSTVRKVADALYADLEINLRPKNSPGKDRAVR
jgi:transcriptional regulator with XRE-family HTH domain